MNVVKGSKFNLECNMSLSLLYDACSISHFLKKNGQYIYTPLYWHKRSMIVYIYISMFSNRNTGFKPLDANNQIQSFVSDMYVIQDVL